MLQPAQLLSPEDKIFTASLVWSFRVVEFLVSKIHIFVALPMLGFTVSALLARLEENPDERDKETRVQLLKLRTKLGSTNSSLLTKTGRQSEIKDSAQLVPLSEMELKAVLQDARHATRLDDYLAMSLLPSFERLRGGIQDQAGNIAAMTLKVWSPGLFERKLDMSTILVATGFNRSGILLSNPTFACSW